MYVLYYNIKEADEVTKHFLAIAKSLDIEKVSFNEKQFRWLLNEDQMATEKLAEGIRKFAADTEKLEKVIREKLK